MEDQEEVEQVEPVDQVDVDAMFAERNFPEAEERVLRELIANYLADTRVGPQPDLQPVIFMLDMAARYGFDNVLTILSALLNREPQPQTNADASTNTDNDANYHEENKENRYEGSH